ncbi:MAG TPA: YicC/YloC family endoribonuclease [Bryobacteraceae bacterium]|nr:YicC/YloC family endoribonuclease [Bryobacteraceae bacterium]
MTGFARVRRALGEGELIVSIKSLNHRSLDVQVHLPAGADALEAAIRAAVKNRLTRGHVEVRVSLPATAPSSGAQMLNHTLLENYVAAFREAARVHGFESQQPDLNAALRLPGMFVDAAESEPQAATEATLMEALECALDQLNEFRAREGAEIAAELRGHNRSIADSAQEIEKIRAGATAVFQQRLHDRLKELLSAVPLDPQRLAQEAAILADRSDIGEELARLKIHSTQLANLIDGGGEVGKKMDFLLQEMNRETNTILSKTNGAGEIGLRVTELAIGAKAAVEKIREQSLNIE